MRSGADRSTTTGSLTRPPECSKAKPSRSPPAGIRRRATRNRLDRSRGRNADKAATYLTNKAAYLSYPTALNRGWPIATGIIEGANHHLV